MPRLLIAHHTPSPPTRALLEEVIAGASDPDLAEVEVTLKPALITTAVDILEADGYLLGTPANFGYMSGALKHMFDQIYYPCLDATGGRPFGFWVHGNDDTTGAIRAISTLTSGLGWRQAAAPVTITGAPDASARAACRELGATVAANLLA
ncbi:MAG TPA: flavodoxin family protein [Kineosporiaceae bacterium]|nr:flavodoxin family protein [Kineosporiaceae bacterium]